MPRYKFKPKQDKVINTPLGKMTYMEIAKHFGVTKAYACNKINQLGVNDAFIYFNSRDLITPIKGMFNGEMIAVREIIKITGISRGKIHKLIREGESIDDYYNAHINEKSLSCGGVKKILSVRKKIINQANKERFAQCSNRINSK